MKAMLRTRLMQVAIVLATGGAGTAAHFAGQPSAAVVLAMEIGAHYESSGKHIGAPYIDKLGRDMNLPDSSFACGFLLVFGGQVAAIS